MSTSIEIVTKSGGDVSNVSSGDITLTQPSIVKLPFGPEEVSGYEQDGNNLIVNLVSGEQEVIYGFFDAQDGERHDLVLEDGEAVVWWGQYESPWSGFTFAEIQEAAVAPVASGGGIPLWALAMGAVTTAVAVDAILDDDNDDSADNADSGQDSSGDGQTDPSTPTVDAVVVNEDSATVSGNSDPGNKVVIRDDAGNTIGEGVADDDGRYEVTTDGPLDEESDYEAVAIDDSGNESDPVEFSGGLSLSLESVTDNNLEIGGFTSPIPESQTLSGTGDPGVLVQVFSPDGELLGETTIDDSGEWQITTAEALAPSDALFDPDLASLEPVDYTVVGTTDLFRTEFPFEVSPPPEGLLDEGSPFITLPEFEGDASGDDLGGDDTGGIAPVVIDLNGDNLIQYTGTPTKLTDDLQATAWVGQDDAVLMWDKYGDGSFQDLEQIAFTEFGGNTDLEGLALEFDSNDDGVFDADDSQWSEFGVWQDADGNGVYEESEFISLEDAGIASLSLESNGDEVQRVSGVFEFGRSTAGMLDGSTRIIADTMFNMKEPVTEETGVLRPSITSRSNDLPENPGSSIIRGNARPGDNVLLYKNGDGQLDLVKNVVVDEFGTFDLTVEPALEDGANYVLYTADPDFTEFSEPVRFTGDTVRPDKMTLESITEISVDGESKVIYQGKAEPNTLVAFFNETNDRLLGQGRVDAEGNFSVVADRVPGGPAFYGNSYVFDSFGNYSLPGRTYNEPFVDDTYNIYEGAFETDAFDENQGSALNTFISGIVVGADFFEADGPNVLTVQVVDANGQVLGESNEVSRTGENANQFEITTDAPLANDVEYDLIALINGERVSLPATVQGDTAAPQAPVIEDISYIVDDDGETTTVIQGSADQVRFEGGLFVIGPDLEFDVSKLGFPDDNSNFQLEVAGEVNLSNGYKIYGYDNYRNVSEPATVGEVEIRDVYNVFGYDGPEAAAEGTLVEGITRPGDLVELRDPDTDNILGVARADENNGEFTLKTSRVLKDDESYSVSSVDENGSISIASSVVGDTKAPVGHSIKLEFDDGANPPSGLEEFANPGVTGNPNVIVSNIEEGADWYWKASPDEEWIKGVTDQETGVSSFNLFKSRDGVTEYYNVYKPVVVQIDAYGNVSDISDFTDLYPERPFQFSTAAEGNEQLEDRNTVLDSDTYRYILESGEVVLIDEDKSSGEGGSIDSIGPIVLDVDKDGDLSYSDNEVALPDLGGATTAWSGAGDGVLMWDKNADTTLTDLDQIAFTEFGGASDLQGLAIGFDSNGDGIFDAKDDAFDEFGIWQDTDNNGELNAGEFLSLEDVGIVAINLESDGVESQPADGVHEFGRGSAVLADGGEMLLSDVAFDYKPFSEDEQNALSVI